MGKALMVVVDTDEQLLYPLLARLIDELPDELQLEVITDRKYLDDYFRTYRVIDLLVISEKDYQMDMKKHQINKTVVLVENHQAAAKEESVVYLYRYSKLSAIVNAILSFSPLNMETLKEQTDRTKVVLVTSTAGGEGKTLLALGIAKSLTAAGKRALYIDAEWMQNFDLYLDRAESLSTEAALSFINTGGKDLHKTEDFIQQENGIRFLSGIARSLASFSKSPDIYVTFVKNIVSAKKYQYIVVDTDSCLNNTKIDLISLSDQIVIVSRADAAAGKRIDRLLSNLNISMDKCLFVSNMSQEEKIWLSSGDYVRFAAHINLLERGQKKSLVDLIVEQKGCQAITYMLL